MGRGCSVKRTPLHLACYEGHFSCVALLLVNRANPLARDIIGRYGRYQLSSSPCRRRVRSESRVGLWDRVPLHYAAQRGNVDIIKYILPAYADDVDIDDNELRTPLMLAARGGTVGPRLIDRPLVLVGLPLTSGFRDVGHAEAVDVISEPAVEDTQDKLGWTAMHYAVRGFALGSPVFFLNFARPALLISIVAVAVRATRWHSGTKRRRWH